MHSLFEDMVELVDATREYNTLLFTGLEFQWLLFCGFKSHYSHY